MNSHEPQEIETLIEKVFTLLEEKNLRTRFDDPVNVAVKTFNIPGELLTPFTNRGFMQVIGEFVAHIYRQVPVLAREFSNDQSQAEAVSLLNQGYHGYQDYAGILRAAAKSGVNDALFTIAETIKHTFRQQYVHCVLVKHVEDLDMQMKYKLVAFLLEHWKGTLPEVLTQYSVKELAPACATLIRAQVKALETIDRITGMTARSAASASARNSTSDH